MHISEGVLSAPVLISGAALTVAGTSIGLKKLDYNRMPQVAILAASFFVASLVQIPVGPASVHLILNGLMGLFLGWAAFPAILIGTILQAVFFQFGGITTLGVNTFNMALPAVICFYLFGTGIRGPRLGPSIITSFLCGSGAVFLGGVLVAFSLVFTGKAFLTVAKLFVAAHLPVMIVEGLIAVFCIRFIKRVKPELLEVGYDKMA